MTTYVFTIRALTNLHVGSGDSGGTGVVDKLVQRDVTTQLPTIHASSLKGAMREHFETFKPKGIDITSIFGSGPRGEARQDENVQRGSHRFFAADILAIPKPVDEAPYYKLVGNKNHEANLLAKLVSLGANISITNLPNHDGDLKELAREGELPVVARNYLDNGVSKNLWYEEIVPRESVFIAAIQAPNATLVNALNNQVVQLGGNATVGYGYCLFNLIEKIN